MWDGSVNSQGNKLMKAILIDVESKDVREVDIGNYKDINKHLKCDIFCIGLTITSEIVLFVDDEGYLKQGPKKFFKFKHLSPMQWLAGNGIFVAERQGRTIDVKGLDIEKIKRDLVFMDCDDDESSPKLPPPIIIPL